MKREGNAKIGFVNRLIATWLFSRNQLTTINKGWLWLNSVLQDSVLTEYHSFPSAVVRKYFIKLLVAKNKIVCCCTQCIHIYVKTENLLNPQSECLVLRPRFETRTSEVRRKCDDCSTATIAMYLSTCVRFYIYYATKHWLIKRCFLSCICCMELNYEMLVTFWGGMWKEQSWFFKLLWHDGWKSEECGRSGLPLRDNGSVNTYSK
jgi:hypothetical protein